MKNCYDLIITQNLEREITYYRYDSPVKVFTKHNHNNTIEIIISKSHAKRFHENLVHVVTNQSSVSFNVNLKSNKNKEENAQCELTYSEGKVCAFFYQKEQKNNLVKNFFQMNLSKKVIGHLISPTQYSGYKNIS